MAALWRESIKILLKLQNLFGKMQENENQTHQCVLPAHHGLHDVRVLQCYNVTVLQLCFQDADFAEHVGIINRSDQI